MRLFAARASAAAATAFIALLGSSFAAVGSLRAISNPPLVDVGLSGSNLDVVGTSVSGVVRSGLPRFELHWDGQPPSAVLVDASTGTVLAATAFSEETYARNRSAVRFTPGEARFVLDARRWSPETPLTLRVEAVKPRRWFLLWSAIAAASAMAFALALAWMQFQRLATRDRATARWHLAGSLAFILISIATFTSAFPGVPVRIDEVTDEASINSFAAVRDHPRDFELDRLLSDRSNYDWYPPLYVEVVRGFKHLGFHYQTSVAFLGGLCALVLLCGLRRLFTRASGRADVAVVATLVVGLMFDARQPPDGELWSILWVIPRTVFAAFVPWVILLAIACAPTSRRWWIPCVAACALIQIHPLSAPALVGAVFIAQFISNDEPFRSRVRGALWAIFAVTVAMLPFAIVYMRHVGGPPIDPEVGRRALTIIRGSFSHVQEGLVLRQLFSYRVQTMRVLVDVFSVGVLLRAQRTRCTRFYLGCVVGFALVTFAVPALDALIADALNRRQLEYELVRNVRYLDLVVVAGITVAIGAWRGTRRHAVMSAVAAAVCAALAFGPGWVMTSKLLAGRSRFGWRMINGRPDAQSAAAQEAIRAVVALRGRDERVSGPVGLRQFGVPLAWTERDVASLSYSPSVALLDSASVTPRVRAIMSQPLTDSSIAELATVLDAQLFVVRRSQITAQFDASPCVLFQNAVYAIVCHPRTREHTAGGRVGRSRAHESDVVSVPTT